MRGGALLDRAWSALISMRTTAVVLVLLSVLMLVNVLVPQEAITPEAYRAIVERGPVSRFLVESVGFGRVSTSPVFRAVLWLFFVSLAAVLLDRTSATLRRVRAVPPTAAQLRGLVEHGALPVRTDRGWSPGAARTVLEGLGYRVATVGEAALWGVRHPAAALGFPLFHASFFVLCAAGLQLYMTRDVGAVMLSEGQRVGSGDVRVIRRAPAGKAPPIDLLLERVDVRLEGGHPLDVAASLWSGQPGAPARIARVNRPAEWGDLTVLVESAGLCPVLSVVDAAGYTRDRVALGVLNDPAPSTVALADGRVRVSVEAIPVGPSFPERPGLRTVRLRTRVHDGDRLAFDGLLTPGAAVPLGDAALRLDEVRYWARLRLVNERGGPLLVLGFSLLIAGIVWRMVWFRREVGVTWDASGVRVGGRGEFYPARFREELASIRELLEDPGRAGIRGPAEEAR